MKKMNNKGFAVSTILYGLLIIAFLVVVLLMSLMASNRKNTSDLVKKAEIELNRYGLSKAEFSYINNQQQQYTVPVKGWYKIELWGASGGTYVNGSDEKLGGAGAYTSGTIFLEEDDTLYFSVGGIGGDTAGGFNGGGNPGTDSVGGGGATDVRFERNKTKNIIMIAAGGSGASSSNIGGAGGTLIGKTADDSNGSAYQLSDSNVTSPKSLSGKSGDTTLGGGGGGYFGGLAGEGGSSYISGYAGGLSTIDSSTANDNDTKHSTGKYFVNGLMVSGVNYGNGKARIQLVSTDEQLPKRNDKFNNVRYIKDCIEGDTFGDNRWLEIQAISGGSNLARDKYTTTSSVTDGSIKDSVIYEKDFESDGESARCVTIDLGGKYNLDEITVWHSIGGSYDNNTLSVSSDGVNWKSLRQPASDWIVSKEVTTGIRYSAWQLDFTLDEITSGNYYIFSLPYENQLMGVSSDDGTVKLEGKVGERAVIWTIEKQSNGKYKITDNSYSNALRSETNGAIGEGIYSQDSFVGNEKDLWTITSLKDGSYIFENSNKSTVLRYDKDDVGKHFIMASKDTDDLYQRFRIVNAEY